MLELFSAPKIRQIFFLKLFLFFPHSEEHRTCDRTESVKKVTCWKNYSSSNIRFIFYIGIHVDSQYSLLIVCFILSYTVRFCVFRLWFSAVKTAGHITCVLLLSINTVVELECYVVNTASGILSWAISWVKTKASRHCWLALLGFHTLEGEVDCGGLCLVEVQGCFLVAVCPWLCIRLWYWIHSQRTLMGWTGGKTMEQ